MATIKRNNSNTQRENDDEEGANITETPTPSDWQHAKILLHRNLQNDYKKPKLWFARVFGVALMLLLYTMGFYFGYDANDDSGESIVQIQGDRDVRLNEGSPWTFPRRVQLAGWDQTFTARVRKALKNEITSQQPNKNVSVVLSNNQTLGSFLEDCELAEYNSAYSDVCIYLHDNQSMYILYPGKEEAAPFSAPLAGLQYAMSQALLDVIGVDSPFGVSSIQQTPELVNAENVNASVILLIFPGVLHCLAAAIMVMFMIGPPNTEQINGVLRSFVLVGVKQRTYILSWVIYYSIHGLLTAAVLTCVSIFYNLMPMSNGVLLFLSHYLGVVGLASVITFLSQIIPQEELAQGMPWLCAFGSMGIAIPCLVFAPPDFPLLTLASAVSPFCGIIQYYAIYTLYDYSGVDTGIHPGENVIESGLLDNMLAQVVCIVFWVSVILLYSSVHVRAWMSSHRKGTDRIVEEEGEEETTVENENFEPLPPGSDKLLEVRGVYHTYTPNCCKKIGNKSAKPVEVLKGLNMDICRGQVFSYLGHNGAGKSTSVQLFSAEHALQEGSVVYNFLDGRAELNNPDHAGRIRGKIGVCPQHNNFLQDDLTCRETLGLFARLKGRIPKHSHDQSDDEAIAEEVQRRLKDIAFTSSEDADKPVGTYSGGMKRKVSIAVALLGNPEVVFLDEPTAGMDPYNRRQIWDMIVAAKPGRSIILTTHFLDEADVLSDRIGILKDGKLITCGGSLFLKHHFGVGYTLRYSSNVSVDISSIASDAERLSLELPERYEWRLQHGTEHSFPSILKALTQAGASDISLDLTTLEQVFLETGKEEEEETEEEDDDAVQTESGDVEGGADVADSTEAMRKIWKPEGVATQPGFWRKLVLVQKFMMINAWKMKGTVFLNIIQPLAYIIVGLVVSSTTKVQDKGERIVPHPVALDLYMAAGSEPRHFFGIPNNLASSIAPLNVTDVPEAIEDYFSDTYFPVFGGYYAENSTLQYDNNMSPFSLQLGIMALSAASATLEGLVGGIATTLQQIPYITDAPFRLDLLLLPLMMGLGFNGVAFSVLDILLLKGDGIVELFRVAGITEWCTYLGVMCYKITTTFTPFFLFVVVLGIAMKSVIMGDSGRWLATIIVMLAYAYSTTPFGMILAKRFIHGDYKSVASWFPGTYMTLVSVPYTAWVSALQALPESRDTLLIIGDILCFIPQVAFQRGLGAVLEVSTKFKDPALTWSMVWSWESRVWFTVLIMVIVGTIEWAYLYKLTTTRPTTTNLRKSDPEDATLPIEVSQDPELAELHRKSCEDAQGINARELVKVFHVPPPSDSVKKDPVLKSSVKGVSFGIRKNEIFALLGPNGAGKSVTMGMLAGQYTPEHGEVALAGKVAVGADKKTDHLYHACKVSYCPQFDALFPKLTVQQHLQLYARIRGLSWEADTTQHHIQAIVKLLGLSKHNNKEATELSGGYKRRLSLGLAMIGYPEVMMVDEATTGMDPGARHLVWEVLKPKFLHDDYDLPALLLSSHYMDECQTLGDTIAIMIDGEIATAGSLSHLQRKYCTSYFVEISLDPELVLETVDKSEAAVLDTFEKHNLTAIVYESLPYRFKLQIPFRQENHEGQLADIFGVLEQKKAELGIKFYSVEQMNLEKIFIDLSKKQFEKSEETVSSSRALLN